MSNPDSKITLKLLIDSRTHKVLFAEAGKDFVDFMFSLLILPLGSIVKLLSPQLMAGSIGKLYRSVENLSEAYLVTDKNKGALLQPMIHAVDGATPLLLAGAQGMINVKYYCCENCRLTITTASNMMCPSCEYLMSIELAYVDPLVCVSSAGVVNEGTSVGGFVKGLITYMITDDLEVTPMSAISSIILVNRFSLKKDVQMEEKVVSFGIKEGIALLEASMESRTVLTNVFLRSSTVKNEVTPSNFVEVCESGEIKD